MNKIKIIGISSEDYPEGRIDSFKIPISEELAFNLISLFEDLGFSESVINDLDMHYPTSTGHHFFFNETIKSHLFFEKEILNLVFDSKMPKEKLLLIFQKYFEF